MTVAKNDTKTVPDSNRQRCLQRSKNECRTPFANAPFGVGSGIEWDDAPFTTRKLGTFWGNGISHY
ncbi:hypothetical protein BRW62_01935 [Parathermosynechococcus lividus PCC 6715]|uniref:Uncharacterized protein n=1 Tax=Parathermosynechococcus lividus PCC 6715 TaxID=1917166 RepID=A0A2D2PZM6_PARLV|nr:hypothetical protein BRW62_01935 [Thermostichus lividus PCC 6715]